MWISGVPKKIKEFWAGKASAFGQRLGYGTVFFFKIKYRIRLPIDVARCPRKKNGIFSYIALVLKTSKPHKTCLIVLEQRRRTKLTNRWVNMPKGWERVPGRYVLSLTLKLATCYPELHLQKSTYYPKTGQQHALPLFLQFIISICTANTYQLA